MEENTREDDNIEKTPHHENQSPGEGLEREHTDSLSRDRMVMQMVRSKALLVFVLLFLVAAVGLLFLNGDTARNFLAGREFSEVFTLVNEKISKSASITIRLPDGIEKAEAKSGISFDPPIEGSWVPVPEEDKLVFDPRDALAVGTYYAVNLATGNFEMRADFKVDEDPEIRAIFPRAGSEAHEDSEITIVFNRPMVPLTTLDELEREEIPVDIQPHTEGRFKWISTRNLQFTPEDRLQRSTRYTITIREGLTSLDGLPVGGQEHSFITRPLRYIDERTSRTKLYDEPVLIAFNQPVDLERTAPEVTVTGGGIRDPIPIDVQYGTRHVYNRDTREYEELEDRSLLAVYQKEDRHGRERFWDFDSSYAVRIAKAYPLEGDIELDEARTKTFTVPNIIENISARSERSSYVRPDLFDPEGELVVDFYEPVDIDSTSIEARGLENVRYAEQCKRGEEEGIMRISRDSCEKEPKLDTLVLTFNPDSFERGETVPVHFKRIYNTEGLLVNQKNITRTITRYPLLRILRTEPDAGAQAASLRELIVCSNSPITPRGSDELEGVLETDGYMVFNRWQNPIHVRRPGSYYSCRVGEFETRIRYGLLPETDYAFTLNIEDDFGQRDSKTISFRTGKAEGRFARFHNMQKVYNVTQPGKTKLTYGVENLEYVNMHICRVRPETFLEKLAHRPGRTAPPDSSYCTGVSRDRIRLPKRYWVNNYFQIDLNDYYPQARGHYIITFSHPDYRLSYGRKEQLYERTYVSITNLAVGEKRVKWDTSYYSRYQSEREGRDIADELTEPGENLYWVSEFNSLAPVQDATVRVYTEGKRTNAIQLAGSAHTNEEGVARTEVRKDVVGAVVHAGQDSAVVSAWADVLSSTRSAQEAGKTYLYTDRPIYRPGQDVHIRGIDRVGYDGTYNIYDEGGASVTVKDSKGEIIHDQELPISAYGTFNTTFTLPDDAPLGRYRINAFGTESRFDVEEYAPAPFELTIASDRDEYVAGETMKLDINAQYFFGVPLSSADVSYTVTSQDYHFDRYKDEYFNFGRGWYYCYSCGYGDNFLFRGSAELDRNGTAHIERELDFNEFYDDAEEEGSKIFIVDVTARDADGRSVSAQRSFIVHRGQVYLGLKADRHYLPENEKVLLRAKSVDTQGEPTAKSDIALSINRVTWDTFKRREVDGGFYYRSEKRVEPVVEKTIRTNRSGNWSDEFRFGEAGQYEIELETTDERGNAIRSNTNLYVYGSRSVSIKPTNNYTLELETERREVDVGDTPTVLIKSPYERAKALITVDRGKIFDYWIVDVDRNLYDFTIPIREAYSPNANVSVLLLSPEPEIKYGDLEFTIDRSQYHLQVDATTDKKHYLPGEDVTVQIETKDDNGKPVSAEVSVAVADLSVLALKGNPKKNPLIFFYDGFPLTVTTASNIKNILYELDIPLGTKGGGGGGGGRGSPDDLARRKRGTFRDTAFWSATVETDETGKAEVSFTLPDNLTTWQIESLGVTPDTLVGVDYDEIISRKDLMVVPLRPRFVVPGDEFALGAKVFNQTENDQSLTVSMWSDTFAFLGDSSTSLSLGAGETETVYFPVRAPDTREAGLHTFVLKAESDLYVDEVENDIAITPNDTYETVATAHFTRADAAREHIYIPDNVVQGKGGLTVNANATMAVFLGDALNYLVSYPYGCSEQLASKLAAIGTVKRGLNIENVGDKITLDPIVYKGQEYTVDEVVEIGLQRIYEAQKSSGGFSYYPTLKPSFYLTLHIVNTLETLRKAGYEIRERALERGISFLYRELTTDPDLRKSKDLVILATFVIGRTGELGETYAARLYGLVEDIARDERFLGDEASSVSLAYLAITTSADFPASTKDRVFAALENRIGIDGRGAYLKANQNNRLWHYYETPIKNTALLLKAITAREEDHELLDKIMRWLLRSRTKDGGWGSTNNTLTAIDAMVDYLEWQRETESDFLLEGMLEGKKEFEFDFNKDTVLETMTHFMPIDTFETEKLHTLSLERTNRNDLDNNFYYDMALQYYLPVDELPPRDEGITIRRALYALGDEEEARPVREAKLGEVLRGKLTLTIPEVYNFVAVEDFIPAGFEIVNFNLATEDQTLQYDFSRSDTNAKVSVSSRKEDEGFFAGLWDRVLNVFTGDEKKQVAQVGYSRRFSPFDENLERTRQLRPDFEEKHDDRIFLFTERMNPGVYEYEYFIRALVPGTFHHLPARASEMYFPEVFGRTEGNFFTVTEN